MTRVGSAGPTWTFSRTPVLRRAGATFPRGPQEGCAPSGRLPQHQRDPPAGRDDFVALVEAAMLEYDDALGRAGLALAQSEDPGFRPDRVAREHRLGKGHLLEAEIADRRSQRRILHGEADDEPQREDGIDQRTAELGGLGVFMIDVDRRRIVGQGGEQDVVHVRHRTADFVNEGLPDLELLKIFAGHTLFPQVPLPGSSRRPYTVCGSRKPASSKSPSATKSSGRSRAKAAEPTTVRPSREAIFSSRAAMLTAGPMQVKSSRAPAPILP